MQIRILAFAGLILLGAASAAPAVVRTVSMYSSRDGASWTRTEESDRHDPHGPKYHPHYGHAGYRDAFVPAPDGKASHQAPASF